MERPLAKNKEDLDSESIFINQDNGTYSSTQGICGPTILVGVVQYMWVCPVGVVMRDKSWSLWHCTVSTCRYINL